jgi:hypothetical protein
VQREVVTQRPSAPPQPVPVGARSNGGSYAGRPPAPQQAPAAGQPPAQRPQPRPVRFDDDELDIPDFLK